MKLKSAALFFVFCLVSAVFAAQPVLADNLGNGSSNTDCLQIGKITKVGSHEISIKTEFEKTAQNYSYELHPDAYVNVHEGGGFKKFSELKNGDLVAVYGWNKDGKYVARRVMVLDPNNYMVKRLEADAKAGVFYKHEK